VSAVCSMEDLPGMAPSMTISSHPLTDIEKVAKFSTASLGRFLYHYDGPCRKQKQSQRTKPGLHA